MFGSKTGSRPTKRSDIYSMGMVIYEVSILRYKSGRIIDVAQVLTDKIPFYEHNEYAAMTRILQGEPPKKPIFSITRGYTQELWDMTTSCWDVEPTKRPTVDRVLDALIIAAEQWRPKHGVSTQDDRDPTTSEESDSPADFEPENEPIDDTSSDSPDRL